MIRMAVITPFFDVVAGVAILAGRSSLLDTGIFKTANTNFTIRHLLALGFIGYGGWNLWKIERAQDKLKKSLGAESCDDLCTQCEWCDTCIDGVCENVEEEWGRESADFDHLCRQCHDEHIEELDMNAETFEAREKKIDSIRIVKNPNFPSGTSLQAYIKTNRAELRKVFGNPNMGESGDGKAKGKEWNLVVGGKRVTIYDRREKGKKGTKYFNIGGDGKYGALLVAQALSNHRNERVHAKEITPKWLEDERRHEMVQSIDDYPDLTYERAKQYEDNRRRRYRAEEFTEIGICDYGLVCDQNIPTPLNEYGICQDCQEQWEYENEMFPLEAGAESFGAEPMFVESDSLMVALMGFDGSFRTDGEVKVGYTTAAELGYEPKQLKPVMWVWDDIEGYGAFMATEDIRFV